jgi:type IV secretory pathway ATPase VirB11/archaellum biosynthesis ATPase
LIYDKDIKEIYCESQGMPLKVKYGDSLMETNISYSSKEQLDNFLLELAAKAGQKIKKKNPSVSFNYRDLYFECTVGFNENEVSKFIVKK